MEWGHSGKGPAEEHGKAGCLLGQEWGVAGTLPDVQLKQWEEVCWPRLICGAMSPEAHTIFRQEGLGSDRELPFPIQCLQATGHHARAVLRARRRVLQL